MIRAERLIVSVFSVCTGWHKPKDFCEIIPVRN